MPTSSPVPTPALAAIKALLFDVFGTVVDWRSSIIQEGEALARRQGWPADRVDWPAFADAWRKEGYTAAIAGINRGESPWQRVDALHRQKMDELLDRFGLPEFSEAERADLNRAWHRLRPWADSMPGLTRLRQRYVVSPLSNGDFGLLTNMAKHAGLPWDCIIAAELFGAYKPSPQTYLGAADLLGLPPEQVLMVAAHPGDLEAARACGLRTAYVHRPLEYGPGTGQEPPVIGAYDAVAEDFLDLAEQLGT
jgi:2-haloacid dehalogenase